MSLSLRTFVFGGIMARHAVADMRATGLLREPVASTDEHRERDLFAPLQAEIRAGALHMSYAFRLLFALENLVRDLISSRLQDRDGQEWFDKVGTVDMKKKYEQRKATEEQNEWHTGRNRHPLYYLDFSDLSKLIVNNWDQFRDLLPDQPWVQSRLNEAERSRNVIAHTNVLTAEEIARLEMYFRDWIHQIG